MFCKNCGERLEVEHLFCKRCGIAVTKPRRQTKTRDFNHDFDKWIAKSVEKVKDQPAIWGGVLVVILILIFYSGGASAIDNKQAVVDVICDNGYAGSGTIFTEEGTILTNYHVVEGAIGCQVTIPDPSTGQIAEIYTATPVVTPGLSKDYDIATVKVNGSFTDDEGKTWGEYPTSFKPFVSPSNCDLDEPPQLGESIRIYGYPITSRNYNLTVTDGIISNFSDSGSILTSAKIDSGNSGGLAVDAKGCWLGIPTAVVAGDYQNLGVIIPGAAVKNILKDVPAKAQPSSLGEYKPASVTNNEICRNTFGSNSVWDGDINKDGRPSCGCEDGYSWDGSGNACASNTSLQASCRRAYGNNSYSYDESGKAMCGCSTGYEWNSAGTACVVKPVCPAYSTYNSSTDSCECWAYYMPEGNSCISATDWCVDNYGYGANYDVSTDKCGCKSGYMFNGDQCVSGYSYCTGRFGYGAEYDYATHRCQCSYGYSVNSAGTWCEYDYGY